MTVYRAATLSRFAERSERGLGVRRSRSDVGLVEKPNVPETKKDIIHRFLLFAHMERRERFHIYTSGRKRLERSFVKRCCKNINITSIGFIESCIYKAIEKPKLRRKAEKLFDEHGGVHGVAVMMSESIKHRHIELPPIRKRTIIDKNSGKVREIGVECALHQLYDYVAVYGAMELFDKKIGRYQCASIPGRGQIYGKDAVVQALRRDPEKTKYAFKGDIHKCYPSIPHDKLIEHLARDIKNPDLLWLLAFLIEQFDVGLSIGSYLSQYLCNYFLSYAYRYASEGLRIVRTRKGKTVSVNPVSHVFFYMDDMLLLGGNKRQLWEAGRKLNEYLKAKLGLEMKPNWQQFRVRYKDDEGRIHGDPIDMMGFRITRYNVTVRKRIFRSINKSLNKVRKHIRDKTPISEHLARGCSSYYGWLKNSDSRNVIKRTKWIFKVANKTVAKYERSKNYVTENRKFGGDSGGGDREPLGCGNSGCVAAQEH